MFYIIDVFTLFLVSLSYFFIFLLQYLFHKWLYDQFPSDPLQSASHSRKLLLELISLSYFLHIALPILSTTRAISPAACVQITKCECDWVFVLPSFFLDHKSKYLMSMLYSISISNANPRPWVHLDVSWNIHIWKVFSPVFLHHVIFLHLYSHCIQLMTHYVTRQLCNIQNINLILTLGTNGRSVADL